MLIYFSSPSRGVHSLEAIKNHVPNNIEWNKIQNNKILIKKLKG